MNSASDFSQPHGSLCAGILRVMAFFALIIVFTPVQAIYECFHKDNSFEIPRLFYRRLIRLLGFRVRVHGEVSTAKPTLFVANHTSYLDIPVLASVLPASFIAKAEVATWPLFGPLAKLQHTVFIERRSERLNDQRDVMRSRFMKGHSLILFPEGTSSDGHTVLPFKSSLFSVAEEQMEGCVLTVQPVSVVCSELDGLPLIRALRPLYSWYGDMTLISHLWNVFKLGHFTVDVVFHPAVLPTSFPDRKKLSAWCQQEVARGVEQYITGRGTPEIEQLKLPPPQATPLLEAKA